MSNFLFLKKNSANLFKIIQEAEKLFSDEYFEQVTVQTRRFAENLCKDLLQDKAQPGDTFDDMISKIKDNSFGNTRMKEFSDDLYFLKKQGNNSAHSSSSAQNGKIALECLERAYEIAIFYSNIRFGYDKKLDKTVFSEELLMTGKKTSNSKPLKAKYSDELKKARVQTKQKPALKPKVKLTQKPKKAAKPAKRKSQKKKHKGNFVPAIIVAIILVAIYFALRAWVLANSL